MSRIIQLITCRQRGTQLSLLKRFLGSQQQQPQRTEDHHTDYVEVKTADGKLTKLSLQWLRDSCECPSCKHPKSGLRLNDNVSELTLKSSQLNDGLLHLTWNDGHHTSLRLDSLLEDFEHDAVAGKKTLWDKAKAQTIPFARRDFQQLLTSKETEASLLDSVLKYGIAIVDGVPPTSAHTKQVMDQFGPIWTSFWGEVYDVVADLSLFAHPSYDAITLKLHTDLCYYHHGPGLQAFHVLEHIGQGGINCFVDGFNVANKIKQHQPEVYEYLSTNPVPFSHYQDSKVNIHMTLEDYLIKHHPLTQQLVQIRYTPYDNDVYRTLSQQEMGKFYHCLDVWRKEINSEENIHWIHLKPGSVLLTDNWRILHGRTSFNGKRTLCGMYISRSDFLSRARILRLI